MRGFFKKLGWQDWALAALILVVCVVQYSQFSQFVQVPGPLYGGDLYYHFGHAMHIKDGGSVFESSHYLGEYEHYPWLFHLIVASITSFFGVALLKAFVFFPIVITVLAGVIFYLLMAKLLKNRTVALIAAALWITMSVPSSHPTILASMVIVPLFVLSLLYAGSRNTKIFAGIAYGLCGLVHVTAFLGASLVIVIFFLYKIIEKEDRKQKINYAMRVKEQFLFFLPIVVIGIIISMLYWWAPIFVYHSQTPNNWQEWGSTGVSSLSLGLLFSVFGKAFFNTSGIILFIISIAALVGLVFSAKKYSRFPMLLIIFISALIGFIHPWITVPLLGTSFGFYRFPEILLLPVSVMLFGVGLLVISNSLKKYRNIILFAAAAIVLINFVMVCQQYDSNQWTQVGRTMSPDMQYLLRASNFIEKNTNVDDVIISIHGESAFAINALTGRKVLYMRETHSSPYVDVNRRKADAAVILYGNNSQLREELIKNYSISYIFVDSFSLQAAASCLQAWDSPDSPQNEGYSYYCLRTSPEYRDYLESNGVETKEAHARLDPASSTAPKLDLIAVKPAAPTLNFIVVDNAVSGNQTIYLIGKIK